MLFDGCMCSSLALCTAWGFVTIPLNLAQGFVLTGWVRNLHDGRVELVVEGEVQELENDLRDLCDEMSGYISNVQRSWEPATGEWKEFAVAPPD